MRKSLILATVAVLALAGCGKQRADAPTASSSDQTATAHNTPAKIADPVPDTTPTLYTPSKTPDELMSKARDYWWCAVGYLTKGAIVVNQSTDVAENALSNNKVLSRISLKLANMAGLTDDQAKLNFNNTEWPGKSWSSPENIKTGMSSDPEGFMSYLDHCDNMFTSDIKSDVDIQHISREIN